MKKFISRLMAVMVAVVMVFGNVPTIEVQAEARIDDARIAIATSGNHRAILVDGDLWLWGSNTFGQIGNDSMNFHYHDPIHIMENVTAVSLGVGHTMAIRIDGSLWAWGLNYFGQLGDGTTTNRHNPVRIMENVTAVSANGWHAMAMKFDGSLWAWGVNAWGQVGDGTTINRYYPVRIMDNVMLPGDRRR